jgi:glycerol-3-phosphate dehydrogenase (NAD(P)+)
MGLAGVGDLVLTCTDDQSRNRRLGLALGHGVPLEKAVKDIGQAVEGLHTAKEIAQIATQLDVDMPIVQHVKGVLYDGMDASSAVDALLAREPKAENL